jgi:hypothetical protein
VPFLLWGLVRLGHGVARELTALALWLGVLIAFHLPYPALRARDLLSVFPVLAICIGAGAGDLTARSFTSGVLAARRPSGLKFLRRALIVGAVLVLFGARVRQTLQWPLHPKQFNTFGYLTARQRAAFDEIQRLTPPEAVLAASLNSGAVNLYSQRETVRPGDWTSGEWRRFVELVLENGQAVFVLVDGAEMQAPKQALEPAYALRPVAELPLPYFYPDGRSENRSVELYQVTR